MINTFETRNELEQRIQTMQSGEYRLRNLCVVC